jgi:hypothetical protein
MGWATKHAIRNYGRSEGVVRRGRALLYVGDMKKSLVVVLGMHRSGTSAITRGLQVLGVTLGDRLMPSQAINAKGFWEDIDVNELNIEMLHALGIDWHYLAPIERSDVDALREKGYGNKAVDLLNAKVGDFPVFGFKDPRVAKLLPFWKEVIARCDFEANYVLMLRHPLSVADSLTRRDGFDVEKSYLLWLGHVITSLAGTAGDNRVLVDYDRLLQSPDHELGRIAKRFDLNIDPAALQSYKTEFLDQELRHTVYGPNELLLDGACSPLACEIYSALLDIASDKRSIDEGAFNTQTAHWVEEFERIRSHLTLVDRLYVRIRSSEQVVAEREGRVAGLTNALAERDRYIAGLTRTIAERYAQIDTLNQIIAECERRIKALIDSNSWRITRPLRALRRFIS